MPVIPATVEIYIEGSWAWVSKKQDHISKITKAKRAEGMPQVVEHQYSKCEALSSNPHITKKKKNHK
jgi:hypothetical protein